MNKKLSQHIYSANEDKKLVPVCRLRSHRESPKKSLCSFRPVFCHVHMRLVTYTQRIKLTLSNGSGACAATATRCIFLQVKTKKLICGKSRRLPSRANSGGQKCVILTFAWNSGASVPACVPLNEMCRLTGEYNVTAMSVWTYIAWPSTLVRFWGNSR